MNDELRILIIADNLLARAGLASLLESALECRVVGQITSGDNLLDALDVYQPDVLVVNLGWQISAMLEALAPLAEQEIPLLALLASEEDAPAAIGSLAAFGVYALLPDESDTRTLSLAIQAAAGGLVVLDAGLAGSLAPIVIPTPQTVDLTPREHEVLQLLAQGMTNKAIAHQLGITEHTIKFHVNAIMTKLDAQSRTEAVVLATRAGLIIL